MRSGIEPAHELFCHHASLNGRGRFSWYTARILNRAPSRFTTLRHVMTRRKGEIAGHHRSPPRKADSQRSALRRMECRCAASQWTERLSGMELGPIVPGTESLLTSIFRETWCGLSVRHQTTYSVNSAAWASSPKRGRPEAKDRHALCKALSPSISMTALPTSAGAAFGESAHPSQAPSRRR